MQDLKAPELRFARSLCREPSLLMVVGDAGQRIYPGGFSLSRLGVETRGRSHVLRLNYRTTEQIRRTADRLLGADVDDLDDGRESRRGTRSLLRGPQPSLRGFKTHREEVEDLVKTVRRALDDGRQADEIGVFVRTNSGVKALLNSLGEAGVPVRGLDRDETRKGVGVGTLHKAKGLEFKVVIVFDVSRGAVPSAGALRGLDDPLDREEAEKRERRLLYVAMTRARDELHVTWMKKPSPFLESLLA